MKYTDYLKTLTQCPFCNEVKTRILIENEEAFLTYAIAPYHKYHLLVIPKRHVEYIKDLTQEENISLIGLVGDAIKILDKVGHSDCSILCRDGKALGKSVNHLHYNIIPGGRMEDISLDTGARKLMSPEEENSLMEELRQITYL